MKKSSGYPFSVEEFARRAKELREKGNKLYEKGHFDEAIPLYNDALTKTRNDNKVDDSLSYANRAAAYLKLEFFEHCLNSLNLAEKHYPRDKIQKLQDRRENCEKLMKMTEDKAKTINPFANMFDKLSYEANPKVPFFINALELEESSVYGRHLITRQELKAGDVICILEDPIALHDTRLCTSICFNCLKTNNFDLQNCDRCIHVFFCSDDCVRMHDEVCLDYETEFDVRYLVRLSTSPEKERVGMALMLFTRILKHFGTIEAMKQFVVENKAAKPTVFDFDWTDPDGKPTIVDIFKMILGTCTDNKSLAGVLKRVPSISSIALNILEPYNLLNMCMQKNHAKYGGFIEKMLRKIYCATEVMRKFIGTVVQEYDHTMASYFHPSMLLLNHSCDPNISTRVMNNGKVAWIVIRPIPAGGQILINYVDTPVYYSPDYTDPCIYAETCEPCKGKWRNQIGSTKFKSTGLKWSPATPMNHYDFVRSTVKSYKKGIQAINASFPADGSKPKNLKAAALLLRDVNIDQLQILESPFLTTKFADFAANKKSGTKNYLKDMFILESI